MHHRCRHSPLLPLAADRPTGPIPRLLPTPARARLRGDPPRECSRNVLGVAPAPDTPRSPASFQQFFGGKYKQTNDKHRRRKGAPTIKKKQGTRKDESGHGSGTRNRAVTRFPVMSVRRPVPFFNRAFCFRHVLGVASAPEKCVHRHPSYGSARWREERRQGLAHVGSKISTARHCD